MNVTQIKLIGNLQPNFMFRLWIPNIQTYKSAVKNNSGQSFTSLIRDMELPEFKKDYKNIRFLNNQVAIPLGDSHEGILTCNMIMDSEHKNFDLLIDWYDSINFKNTPGYNGPFVTAYLELLGLDGTRGKVFRINGMSPVNKPAISDLNYENTEGFVMLPCQFAYDSIDWSLPASETPDFPNIN